MIHDVRWPAGTSDWLLSGLAAVLNGDALWWIRKRLRESRAFRDAWRAHGSSERYLTMAEVRALGERTLPRARVFRHPLWRYTLVWTRDDAAA